jgi:hypothetical protein
MPLPDAGAIRVVVYVVDHPDIPPTRIASTIALGRVDPGQIGVIGQVAGRPEDGVIPGPRQEVGPASADPIDRVEVEEAAIPDQQHARADHREELTEHRGLAISDRLEGQAADRMIAQFAEGLQPDLGECGVGPGALGPAESAGVGRSVGQVECHAIDPHQAPAAVEGPLGLAGRHGPGDLEEELAKQCDPEPLAGLVKGGIVGLPAHRRWDGVASMPLVRSRQRRGPRR